MTREEAIGIMNYLKHYAETDIKERDVSEEKDRIRFIEALDMAIQALENHDTFMKYAYSQGKHDALSQEPCDDAVSREAVLKIIDGWYEQNRDTENIEDLIILITYMQSVQPSRKGHWIKVTNGRGGHECDKCHDYAPSYQSGDEYLSDFCPNCGAKMERGEKE